MSRFIARTYDEWKTTDPTELGEICYRCQEVEGTEKVGRIYLCEHCYEIEERMHSQPEYEYEDRYDDRFDNFNQD